MFNGKSYELGAWSMDRGRLRSIVDFGKERRWVHRSIGLLALRWPGAHHRYNNMERGAHQSLLTLRRAVEGWCRASDEEERSGGGGAWRQGVVGKEER
jgi:hypothetical protein